MKSEKSKSVTRMSTRSLWIFSSAVATFMLLYLLMKHVPSAVNTVVNSNISFLDEEEVAGNGSTFELRHIFHHGSGKYHRIHRRLDITEDYLERNSDWFSKMDFDEVAFASEDMSLDEINRLNDWPLAHKGKNPFKIQLPIKAKEKKSTIQRLKDRHVAGFIDSYLDYARSVRGNPKLLNMINLEWEDDKVLVPDVEDVDTVVSLATISSNAYVRLPKDQKEKDKSDWKDVGDPWYPDDKNDDIGFGWDQNGLRGHVFVSKDNKTVVIGIKGTSGAGLIGAGSEDTATEDKNNDNLLFSCCCARVSYLWSTVCDCYDSTYTCNQDCLEKELLRKDRFYQAALEIYRNVTKIYPPDSTNIWVTGHSLGGSLASLLGRTYGLPVVAIEAPGEMLATKRLHLPLPPGIPRYEEHIWHIGNTADPLYLGVCNGASSSCNIAGYAMETACHTGKQCVYDVVTDLGWSVSLLNHRIHTVIDDIIKVYNSTPSCVNEPPCHDCFNWHFISKDDSTPDEPKLPNPLNPTTSKFVAPTLRTTTSSSTSESSSTSTSSLPVGSHKCLHRNFFRKCTRWDDDDTGILP